MLHYEKKAKTVTINNSTEYKQNEQSPLILYNLLFLNTMTYDVGNPGPDLEQAQRCGRIKLINGIPTHLRYKSL